jgi:hypothetical protein
VFLQKCDLRQLPKWQPRKFKVQSSKFKVNGERRELKGTNKPAAHSAGGLARANLCDLGCRAPAARAKTGPGAFSSEVLTWPAGGVRL